MKKIFLFFIASSFSFALRAQLDFSSDNICHDKERKLKKMDWRDYSMKFSKNTLDNFYTNDSSFFYDYKKKKIRLILPTDTLTVTLNNQGIELTTHKSNSIFIPISNKDYICDNEDKDNLVKVNKLGALGILPMFKEKCKFIGLVFPVINNRGLLLFFFRDKNKNNLCWDIVIESLKDKNYEYHKVKFFSSETNGQMDAINLSSLWTGGVKAKYKTIDSGIEFSFINKNATTNMIWKIQRVFETENAGVNMYQDIIEYNKKGSAKKSRFDIRECAAPTDADMQRR